MRGAGRRHRVGVNRRGPLTVAVLAGTIGVSAADALAQIDGADVTHGTATFEVDGSVTTITTSDTAIINYQSFGIAAGETVRFVQPSATSRVLNRINGAAPTHINGTLQSNGIVYFVNRAGVFFGQGAVVDVGGIYAAAGSIADSDFLSGVDRFTSLSGPVVNNGEIRAGLGGAHFIGSRVENFGTVITPAGVVTMTAGEDVLIGRRGGRVFARVTTDHTPAGDGGVTNAGTVNAAQAVIGVGDHYALALLDTSQIAAADVMIEAGDGSRVTLGGTAGGDIEIASRGDLGIGAGAVSGAVIDPGSLLLDRGSTLTLRSGTGNVWFGGTPGPTAFAVAGGPLATVTGGTFTLTSTNGPLTLFDAGDSLGIFQGGVTLSASAANPTDGDIVFINSTPGEIDLFGLTADATGTIEFGANVTGLTSTAGATLLLNAPVETREGFTFNRTGGAVRIDGNVRASGGLTFDGPSEITGEVSALSLAINGPMTVGGDLSASGGTLTVDGAVTYTGAFSLDVSGSDGVTINSSIAAGSSGSGRATEIRSASGDIAFGAGGSIETFNAPLTLSAANGLVTLPTVANAVNAGFGAVEITAASVSYTAAQIGSLSGSSLAITTTTGGLTLLDAVDYSGFNSGVSLTTQNAAAGQLSLLGSGTHTFPSLTLSIANGIVLGPAVTGVSVATGTLDLDAGAGDTSVQAAAGTVRFDTPTIRVVSDLTTAGAGLAFGGATENLTDAAQAGGVIDASGGDIVFESTLTMRSSVRSAGGSIRFVGDVDIGPRFGVSTVSIAGAGAGEIRFESDVVSGFGDGLTLELGTGSAVFQGRAGDSSGVGPLFDVVVIGAAGGSVDFQSAIDARSLMVSGGTDLRLGGPVTLTQVSGAGGTLSYTGGGGVAFGAAATVDAASDVTIAASTITGDAGITVVSGGAVDWSGTTSASGAVELTGVSIAVTGDTTAGTGGAGGFAARGGLLTLEGSIAATGDVIAEQGLLLRGARTIATGGGSAALNDIDLEASGSLAVSTSGGNVTVASIDGLTPGAASVSFDTGGGALSLGVVGSGGSTALASLAGNAGAVTLTGGTYDAGVIDLTGTSFAAAGPGSGTLRLGGDGTTAPASSLVALRGGSLNASGFDGVSLTAIATPTPGSAVVLGGFEGAGLDLSIKAAGLATVGTVGSGGAVGNVSLIADDLALVGTLSGVSLEIAACTPGLGLTVGDAPVGAATPAGPVIDRAELALLSGGFSSLTLGSAAGGGVTAVYTTDPVAGDLTLRGGGNRVDVFAPLALSSGALSITDNATLNDGASLTTAGGSISLGGTLGVGTGASIASGGGMISVAGDIDALAAGGDLTIDAAAGTVSLASVGAASPLNALDLTGGALLLSGSTYDADAQRYDGPTTFSAPGTVAINADTGDIEFTGAAPVTLADGTSLSATAGGAFTSGAIDAAAGALTPGSVTVVAGGQVTTGTIGTAGRVVSVSLTGSNVSANSIDAAGPVTLTGAGIALTGSSYTSGGGAIDFNGDASFMGATAVMSSGGDVAFNGTVTSVGGPLTVDAGTGDIRLAGGSVVGESISLTAMTIALLADTAVTLNGAAPSLAVAGGLSLNSFDLSISATDAGAAVAIGPMIASGGETVDIAANGAVTLGGMTGGAASLALLADNLSATGLIDTDAISIDVFTAGRVIALGATTPGVLGLDTTTLGNISTGGTLAIGSAATGGITIDGATLSRATTITAGGTIAVQGAGLTQSAGGATTLTGPAITLAADIGTPGPAFGLTLDGPVAVAASNIGTAGGAVTLTGALEGAAAGTGDLAIDTGGGAVVLPANIGGAASLASFTVTAPNLSLGSVTTTGVQSYNGAATLLGGTLSGGSVAFASPVSLTGDTTVMTTGSAAFNGDISSAVASSLTINAGGQATFQSVGAAGALDDFSVTAGSASLAGNILISGDLNLAAPTTLVNSITLAADNAVISGTVDAMTAGIQSLTINTQTGSTITGAIGSMSPLGSFTSGPAGTAVLASNMTTQGGFLAQNPVVIIGPVRVQTLGTTSASSIRFNSTIDAGAFGSLTLITSRTGGELAGGTPTTGFPRIELVGSIGSISPLLSLSLNFDGAGIDGRTTVPGSATIIFGSEATVLAGGVAPGVSVTAGSINVGVREKIVAAGDLSLNGFGSIRIGDVASLGSLTINAPSVVLLAREASSVFDPTTDSIVPDLGTDIVASRDLVISRVTAVIPVSAAAGPIQLGVPGGNPLVESDVGPFVALSLETDVRPLTVASTPAGLFLVDPRADGPSNTDVAESLAGQIPRDQQGDNPEPAVTIDPAALEILRELGIRPRVVTAPDGTVVAENTDEGIGVAGVYNDVPEDPNAAFSLVTVDRLEEDVVNRVVDTYRDLFLEAVLADDGTPEIDPDDGRPVERSMRGEIRAALSGAVERYFDALESGEIEVVSASDFDADQFLAFTAAAPADSGGVSSGGVSSGGPALARIAALRGLLGAIELMGLAPREAAAVKSTLIGAVRPPLLTPAELDAVLSSDLLGSGAELQAVRPASGAEQIAANR